MSNKRNKERIPLTKEFFNFSHSNIFNTINYNLKGVFNVTNNVASTIFSSQRNELHELQEKYFLNESTSNLNNQILKEDHSEIVFKDNEVINLNSISKDKVFFIKTKDNSNIEVNLAKISAFTILELKKYVFPKIFEEKNIRLIFNGRILNDSELITVLNFDAGAYIHAFISEKLEKQEKTVTNISNNEAQNAANSIRGFERIKDIGIPSENVILQKFAFHAHFILTQKESQIEFTNLVNREDEWFAMNIEQLGNLETNTVWFKAYDFNKESDPEKIKNNLCIFRLLLAFSFGFFAMILIFPFIFARRINTKVKEAMLIGLISKMFYICLVYLIIKEMRFII